MKCQQEANGMLVVDQILRQHGWVAADEVWVHGMWTPGKWFKCVWAKLLGKKLVRMIHGGLSPIYLERHGKWKKKLVKPIERFCFGLADRIVATGPWEVDWMKTWGLKRPIEIVDLKQFFHFDVKGCAARLDELERRTRGNPLHLLYLGRKHVLKGIDALERAVDAINSHAGCCSSGLAIELREVFDHFGDELDQDWEWADLLVLPTLSENFGMVVAESLQRGIPVLTTDGAPAWLDLPPRCGVCIVGYRDGNLIERTRLLKDALMNYIG